MGKSSENSAGATRRASVPAGTGSTGLTGSGLGGRIDTGVVKYTPRLDGDSFDDIGKYFIIMLKVFFF